MINFVVTNHKTHEENHYSDSGNPDCRHRLRSPRPDRYSIGEKNEIKLNPYKGKGDDKSLFADVEAWYDSSSMTVTVKGCELKDTFIYIMSPDGLVLAQTSHYFGITPETCTIEVPSLPGKYWLVIDSPALYAEGPFLIN